MGARIGKIDLEHDLVRLLTKEAVTAGLESALREPILEAVEATTGETIEAPTEEAVESSTDEVTGRDGTSAEREKSRLTKVIQGGIVFVVMFVVLYGTLRRLTGDETVS